MVERATINEVAQIGVEAVEGTAVAGSKLLPSIAINLAPATTQQQIKTQGYKVPTGVALGKEWSTVDISSDAITYDELTYLFNMILVAATPAQQSATTAYKSTFAPLGSGPDTVKTITAESGSSARAMKAAGLFLTDLTIDWDREKVSCSGSGMGRAITDGITMTASPTAIAQVPILAKDLSIYADDTSGGLGTTKLLRSLKGTLKISNRFGPVWPNDKSQPSYAARVELPITITLDLWLEADAAGMGFLTTLRNNARKFIRLDWVSDLLAGTAIPYELAVDLACDVGSLGKLEDDEGVYGATWTFNVDYDSAWAKWISVALTNKTTAL